MSVKLQHNAESVLMKLQKIKKTIQQKDNKGDGNENISSSIITAKKYYPRIKYYPKINLIANYNDGYGRIQKELGDALTIIVGITNHFMKHASIIYFFHYIYKISIWFYTSYIIFPHPDCQKTSI